MYNSPIEKIFGEIQNEILRKDEEHLMTVVSQNVGYVVDKTELLKALQYDRSQYEKGYADAKAMYETKWIPISERLPKIADVYRVTRYFPNNVMNPRYMVDACFFDGSNIWYSDNRINHERACVDNIIAWQENPKPYKPGSEEKE